MSAVFISLEQIEKSLIALAEVHPFFGTAFLAFKQSALPIGNEVSFNFSQRVETVLQRHYRVTPEYEGFYNPFVTSSPAKRWTSARYGSTTLQRIVADTFADAFLHEKRTSNWAWDSDYVNVLSKHLAKKRIPTFDLAVWLYRDAELPKTFTPAGLCSQFISEFRIGQDDATEAELFEEAPNHWGAPPQDVPVPVEDLLNSLGHPPGLSPAIDLSLRRLRVKDVGPAGTFDYEPAPRLNVITGDNSLGKTFVLDLAYWALTGTWSTIPATPQETHSQPSIEYELGATTVHSGRARYDWLKQSWTRSEEDRNSRGLVIYARFDGSFTVWDPIRSELEPSLPITGEEGALHLLSSDVWRGLKRKGQIICDGLLADCVRWMVDRRADERFDMFTSCLRALSPTQESPIALAAPKQIATLGARESPCLSMPYGPVPLQLASAGIRRILSLAYMLVWTAFENKNLAAQTRTRPHRRIVILIDELEAHLHPRWQRTIIPGLIEVINSLTEFADVQFHIATHSPLVMASAEPVFEEGIDELHHLRLDGGQVILESLPFSRRGTSDYWLMSDVFDLKHPRSLAASEAIETAKKLQRATDPNHSDIAQVHARLCKLLAQDDPLWPRWLSFAENHGVRD